MLTQIVPFTREHHAACFRLVSDSLTEVYQPEVLLNIADSWPGRSFVALSGEDAVGYIAAMRTPDLWTRILLFAVTQPLRGMGIGSKLFDAVTARALMERDKGILLELREGNPSALSFYRSRGFRTTGRIDGFYQNGENALVMTREFS